jgi:hypothetical protein
MYIVNPTRLLLVTKQWTASWCALPALLRVTSTVVTVIVSSQYRSGTLIFSLKDWKSIFWLKAK